MGVLLVACSHAWRTGRDVEETAAVMGEGIIEAALKEEDFLSRPDAQIVTRGKWAAQNKLRRQRRCIATEDETLEWLAATDGGINTERLPLLKTMRCGRIWAEKEKSAFRRNIGTFRELVYSLGDRLIGRTADSGSASRGSNPCPPACSLNRGISRYLQ